MIFVCRMVMIIVVTGGDAMTMVMMVVKTIVVRVVRVVVMSVSWT